MSELERAIAFIRAFEDGLADEIVPTPSGRALLTPTLPRVYYLNKFSVTLGVSRSSEELIDEVEPIFAGAGLAHRKIVGEGELGRRLAPEFRERSWKVEELLVMPHVGPAPSIETGGVEEVRPDELEPLWIEGMRSSPEIQTEDEIRQLVEAQHRRRRAVRVRYFAARVEGKIASYCELFSDGRTAQIESVMTLEPFRGRGLAKAVVSRALAESHASGHDLTFLEADVDDWPKELYRRLGFEAAGTTWGFLLLPSAV